MLTRAVSAPAYYGAPGILRYTAEPPSTHSNVKFAPLPQTEVFGRRARFSSRLGVQGRKGILNKQRQRPNGINYDPNNTTKETTEATALDDAAGVANNANATDGSTPHQASENANFPSPQPDSSLDLRRSASEDGTESTSSSKRGNSLKFWKKSSKRPGLPTIPSQAAIHVPDLPRPLLQVAKEPGPHVGPSRELAAPHVEIATPSGPAKPYHELHRNDMDPSPIMVEDIKPSSSPSSPTIATSIFTLQSSAVSTPSTEPMDRILDMMAEPDTEGVSEEAGVMAANDAPSDGAATSNIIDSLGISIHILDGKGTPSIVAPSPTAT